MHTKSLALRGCKSTGAPTPEQLAEIRPHMLADVPADELVVREFILAHNGIDRDSEVFSTALLEAFERTLPGKGVHIRHPGGWDGDSGPGEGKVFGAQIERMSLDAARAELREPSLRFPPDATEAALLRVRAYYVRTPENASTLRKMDAGIGTDVSIGFVARRSERLKDANGVELNVWRWDVPGEALEMSHVWLGAQPGARATKSATRGEHTVDDITALKSALAEANTKADANAKAATALAGLKAALGDSAALLDNPAALAEAVASGKAFRESLVQDIVTAERHLGITADDADAVKAAHDLYAGMTTDRLTALAKGLAARLPGGTTGKTAGDPNSRPAPPQPPSADSPLGNPAFA